MSTIVKKMHFFAGRVLCGEWGKGKVPDWILMTVYKIFILHAIK
jgi:hypothetical protein